MLTLYFGMWADVSWNLVSLPLYVRTYVTRTRRNEQEEWPTLRANPDMLKTFSLVHKERRMKLLVKILLSDENAPLF